MGDYESGYDPKYGYNRNAFAHKTPVTAILGRTVKLIAAPIGLVSEAIHHRKDSKADASQSTTTTSLSASKTLETEHTSKGESREDSSSPVYVTVPAEQAEELIASKQAVPADGEAANHELVPEEDYDDPSFDKDEADWALDEATLEVEGSKLEEKYDHLPRYEEISKISATPKALPFPVVLPQQRPGTKSRGFVHAYAPVLQDSGINQDTFLKFLQDFQKAAKASPIFDIVLVATAIAGAYPDPLVGLGIQAVQVATAIGQEVQERWATNTFLDQANKDIFVPRGLYALIVTYVPSASQHTEVKSQTIDIAASAVVKYNESISRPEDTTEQGLASNKPTKMDELREKAKKLRIDSGKTHGEAEMPATCAPLVFPSLDTMADAAEKKNRNSNEGFSNEIKEKTKSTSKFVQTYFDRRAQAAYAGENPNSTLTKSMGPSAPQFKSRFADPNNATNTHFFTLITGGRWKAEPLGARRRYEKAQRKAEERRLKGLKEKSSKRMLQEGILYLTIVNMPTKEELEKAKNDIKEAKEKKAAQKSQ